MNGAPARKPWPKTPRDIVLRDVARDTFAQFVRSGATENCVIDLPLTNDCDDVTWHGTKLLHDLAARHGLTVASIRQWWIGGLALEWDIRLSNGQRFTVSF